MQDETHLTVYVSVTLAVGLAFDGTGPLNYAMVRAAAVENFMAHPALQSCPDLDGNIDRMVIERADG